MTKEMEAFTQHINDGLDQLPAFSGETYRGMNSLPSHILDGYTPGKTVIDPAFVSTDVNQGFSGPIQMRIEGFPAGKLTSFQNSMQQRLKCYLSLIHRLRLSAGQMNLG